MERAIKARGLIRREFDNLSHRIEEILAQDPVLKEELKATYQVLTKTFKNLGVHDNTVFEAMLDADLSEENSNDMMDEMTEFRARYERLTLRKDEALVPPETNLSATSESVHGAGMSDGTPVRNFKLPVLETKKFSGQLIDWLGFWSNFEKIHEDPYLHGSDKFSYLLQALEKGSDGYEIVSTFPPSNENYPKAVQALKEHYGNEEVLLQVYIREILKLVTTNANSKEKIPVKQLYLKLKSYLGALDTLKLKNTDRSTWLFPLVESCLPDRMLYGWQRNPSTTVESGAGEKPQTKLDQLMEFVKKEVQIQRNVDITRSFAKPATTPFRQSQQGGSTQEKTRSKDPRKFPLFSSMHSGEVKSCVFCEKNNHDCRRCFKAKKMTYDEKVEALKSAGLCFRCCQSKHISKDCPNQTSLNCGRCGGSHEEVMCQKEMNKRRSGPEDFQSGQPSKKVKDDRQSTSSFANLECSHEVSLQTVMLKLVNGGQEKLVRAFIDKGCQRTYVLRKIAEAMKLQPNGIERVTHNLFGGLNPVETHQIFDICVRSVDNKFTCKMEIREKQRLGINIPRVQKYFPNLVKELKKKGIMLSDMGTSSKDIDLVIGADMYEKIMIGESKKLESGGVAINTKFGWTLLGKLKEPENVTSATKLISSVALQSNIAQLWELDVLGIRDPAETSTKEKLEIEATLKFQSQIAREPDGRYLVKMPWKMDHPPLPTNREIAFRRLETTSKKLIQAGFFQTYGDIFLQWEAEDFIERVTPSSGKTVMVHYLPHRAVIKESRTTPVRPVFDASCRSGKSPSLNDCLYKGPNYIKLIPDVLLRFREKEVAFVADIRKAFQMISVDESDRDAMRFLWWTGPDMKEVIEYRHSRVMFGATCSPFILGAVLAYHLENVEEGKEIAKKLLHSLYVDNCVASTDTTEDYEDFRNKSINLLKEAQMDLREWFSNKHDLQDEDTKVMSVLGLQWDRKTDELYVSVRNTVPIERVTKRIILSHIQRIFDPNGFTSPAVLPMKLLLQRTCLMKKKWDEELPEDIVLEFRKWMEEVKCLEDVRVKRLATAGVTDKKCWSLHTFTDASQDAYSAASFLRVEENDLVDVQLLGAKSRVAPMEKTTIPRLELLGCVIGSRLADSIIRTLKLEEVKQYYWSDSTTALAWIKRNEQWGTFVGNRTKEIAALTESGTWKHVPGILNPADLPSRGCTPRQLLESKWWEGPHWLRGKENTWPNATEDENEVEIAGEVRISAVGLTIEETSILKRIGTQNSYSGMVRIVGWIRRFLHNKFTGDMKRHGKLSLKETKEAEFALIRCIQKESYPPKELKQLRGFEVFVDDVGLLRVKTRLTYLPAPESFKYPMLLPGKRNEVKLLIHEYHRIHCHARTEILQVILRKKYWITQPRVAINSVIQHCVTCRKLTTKPLQPHPAPLPLDRIRDAEVFQVTGVDLAGPLTLRNGKKVWLVIFTCAIYRAVHLELVSSLSTKAFIKVLAKFIERFRRPEIVYSDNGTNFHGANNLFKNLDWEKIENEENVKQIVWKFNPATAAWYGAFWERMIQSVKNLLVKSVGKGTMNYKELEATIKKVSDVLNDRPLTAVSQDPNDLEPLTPALFLHPIGSARFPEIEGTESEKLRLRYKHIKSVQEALKKRFQKEYVAFLVNRKQKKVTKPPGVGDLVLVGSDNMKRIHWPMGKILEIFKSKDGEARIARVKTAKGECTRPFQRLYPLELDGEEESETDEAIKKVVRTRSGRVSRAPVRY